MQKFLVRFLETITCYFQRLYICGNTGSCRFSVSYQSEEIPGDVIPEWGMVYLRMAVVTPVLSVFLDPFAETAQLFVKYLLNCYSLAD